MITLLLVSLISITSPAPRCSISDYYDVQSTEFVELKKQDTNFPVPNELIYAVAFWKKIFLTYDSSVIVIHDRDNLNIIWDVIKLPVKDGKVDEYNTSKFIKNTISFYQERIKRVSFGIIRDDLDSRLLKIGTSGGKNNLRFAWDRVRVQRGVADKFAEGLENYSKVRNTIHGILKDNGLPVEIAALPFVESSYNNNAKSSCGAASTWQIMRSTAKFLGLKISKKTDERYDIIKSTRAAARLLKIGFNELGSWPLSLTAYNAGIGNIRKAVRQVGSKDIEDLIERYQGKAWGFAVDNYYASFLAALEILRDKGLME